ncbi:hypothetical protein DB346_02665 [Verrucomicrobia bacterium LW23]|nr:hypothetical protein DB346_03990 [Verrucomicrobia bacterium LW23]PTY04351.1 hypothetical protein DB346_02665 [Verrucomicrobia bacterium LW23]
MQTDIQGPNYRAWYDAAAATVHLEGTFRLSDSQSYAPIHDLLERGLEAHREALVVDLRQLQFLNSSGLNVLTRFAISARKSGATGMTVLGSTAVSWHSRSLPTLQRLFPALVLRIEPPAA